MLLMEMDLNLEFQFPQNMMNDFCFDYIFFLLVNIFQNIDPVMPAVPSADLFTSF